MMKNFSFYEQVGVVIPGSVLLVGVINQIPTVAPFLSNGGVSVGDLGVFLLVAYALGHGVAAVGNIVETVFWWLFGGMPSDWVTHRESHLLSGAQVAEIRVIAAQRLSLEIPDITGLTRSGWRPFFGQIYRYVLVHSPGRIETFNGNYGLNRGLASAFLLLIPVVLVKAPTQHGLLLGLVILVAIYLFRMYRFGVHFAREVYFLFLNPSQQGTDNGSGKSTK